MNKSRETPFAARCYLNLRRTVKILCMLYWECNRRLAELHRFRALVRAYFANSGFDALGKRHVKPDAGELRTEINRMLPEIVRSAYKVGHSLSIEYVHPGYGVKGHINLIENLFGLDQQQIPVSKAFDYLDRVIGEYERLQVVLRRRSWNPFYWLSLGFLAVLHFPFTILGAAGFNAKAFEQSLGGKIVKLVVGFVVFLAALLQTLSLLGLPTGWKNFVRLIRHG